MDATVRYWDRSPTLKRMQSALPSCLPDPIAQTPLPWWRRWSPFGQDRVALVAPLLAVLLFLGAIVSAFWYLRMEGGRREQEAVKRDVE